ncbi:MAG: mucoidy inhibitor MuiA family protein [Winogradskyella sp.]|nr:mucoidy inhibitor MuiA family protein [Winogradskyella sp.]
MKTLTQLLLIFLITTVLKAQENSKITNVTVYLDGAEINRTASITLKPGTKEFILNNLSPYIEESSIQVSGLQNTSILSINYGINYLSKQKQTDSIVKLNEDLKSLDDKIQYEHDLIAGYNEEISLIQNNKDLSNQTKVVSLEQLKNFAEYYRKRITELKKDIYKANKKIENYKQQQNDIRLQLAEFNIDEKVQTGEIKLKLNSKESVSLDLKITYNVKNAGWFPIYDLKADKINSPINLEYKAHIFQNTGCDWEDVNLVLSTSDPNTNNQKPIVNPKYLNFISPYSNYQSQRATRTYNYKYNPLVKTVTGVVTTSDDGLPLPGANVIEKGTTNGTQTDFDGRYSLKTTTGNTLVYSYVGMKTEELPIHSSIMNVAMDYDAQLDEVVITGYTSKKENRPNAGFVQTLSGQFTGLNINNTSGQPGANSLVQLRGVSSIRGNTEPLFIINGSPVDEGTFKSINENDIASINVLKDTQATSIYGNRGANGVVVITLKPNASKRVNELGITIDTGITNTRFEIDRNYTIPSNEDVTVIEIDKFSVPAKYDYFAAPILNENVFLTAKIGNWEQYSLLPAEANVYFEGSYSGKTNINPGATTDSLTISLGVDPNIVVKRTQRNDFKKTTFIGNNKIVFKAFDIEVRNNKKSDIVLTLIDRIPITQNRDIKLDDIEIGTSVYDKDKGILKWNLSLKSGETDKVEHSYSVKFPKGKRVNF